MTHFADHGGEVVGHMFNDDFGGPRPSMYRPRRSENDQSYVSRASSLVGSEGGISRSNNNPAQPGPPFQPPATPFPSGPLPYASSNTSSTFSSGPGLRSQPPPMQHASTAPGGEALHAQAPHAGPGPYPGVARPPLQQQGPPQQIPQQPAPQQQGPQQQIPQQQQQQPYQAPPPNNTGVVSDAASSIYSMPGPVNAHNSSTHTTSGAYYAPTTNSSSSDLNGGYGYAYPGQAQQPYQQPMYQQHPQQLQQPYQQHPQQQQQQQYQTQGINPSSVFTATSYSPTQGPPFNPMNGPRPSSAYGLNNGPPAQSGPMNVPISPVQEKTSSIRMESAGKLFLGALATGAVAYGIREYRENRENSAEQELKEKQRRKQEEANARWRREEEERQRLKAYNEMHGNNADHHSQSSYPQQTQQPYAQQTQAYAPQQTQAYAPQQTQAYAPQQTQAYAPQPAYQQQQSYPQAAPALSAAQAQAQAHAQHQHQHQHTHSNSHSVASYPTSARHRSVSIGSSGNRSHASEGFQPPAPFGRPSYTFSQNDVRHPDPSRSTENSQTAETYPELRQNPGDTKMKIGTILALRHNASGRHLRTDRSHSTSSGSNQQLAYAHRWTTDEDDWWQVLPANTETPAPGSIVSYGTQVRLRHYETGRHLHSHYGFVDAASGQNEVTAYGDQRHSDENDHWVIERWGDGGYGKTWKSTDPIVLRHYVSGMVLHSHDTQNDEEFQPVVCTGMGNNENDKWRVVLGS
ncbi:hypothetical protein H4R20_005578 [Coemansia guatemalensis]|uniref:MIR domain-containing protein n=1 Tax=Coemansia guatemalensis TaxID=2761395 RepID=A0A9W8HQ27_9FUNG|nr:hypothetical protein H4R20_005578 [Coemansia guatemalensis]